MQPKKDFPNSGTDSGPKGAFLPDGSYDPHCHIVRRKGTDRLTRSLLARRQRGSITPTEAAGVILEAKGSGAFPNVPQWASCSFWALAVAETSCEAVVKYCGAGSREYHWCGENFLATKQSECSNPDHWRKVLPEEAARFFDTLRRAFG